MNDIIRNPFTDAARSDVTQTQFTTAADRRSEASVKAEAARATPFGDLYQAGVENSHAYINALQYLEMEGHEFDDDYVIDGDRLMKDLAEAGIPESWADEWSDTLSEQHYQAKLRVFSERAANDRKLMEAGGKGLGAAILSALTDPVGAAVDAVAAPLAAGTKGSRLYRIGRAALGAGAANVAVGQMQGLVDPEYDYKSVLIDAAAGAGFGILMEGGGQLLRKHERKEIFDSFYRSMRSNNAAAFGDDSLSAARVAGSHVEEMKGVQTALGEGRAKTARETLDELADDRGLIRSAVGSTFRMDWMRHVDAQGDDAAQLLRALHSDPTGVAGGGVNHTGAVERANKVRGGYITKWRQGSDGTSGYEGALKEYFREQGATGGVHNWWKRQFSREGREEFSRMVGETALRGTPHKSAAVNRAVESMRGVSRDAWSDGATAGVRGMTSTGGIADFSMSRVIRPDLWQFIRGLGRTDTRALEEPITELFRQSIRNGRMAKGLELDDELTDKVAKAYSARVMGAKDDAMGGVDRMTELRLDYLGDVLEEAGLKGPEIDDILAKFVPEKTKGAAVPTDRLKHRLELDMEAETILEDGTKLRMLDFFDTHAERVTDNYLREMAGHTALAQTGFQSWREVDGLMQHMHRVDKSLDDKGYRLGQGLLRATLGRPLAPGEASGIGRAARLIMDQNFLSTMGSVAYSMVAENGKILGTVGFRAAMQQFPAMKTIIRQAVTGEIPDDFARQMASMWGTGNSMMRNQVSLRADDYNIPGFTDGVMGSVDRAMQVAKRFQTVASGLGPLQDMQQQYFGRSILQHLYNADGKISNSMRTRLRDYGLQNKEINAVLKHLRTEGQTTHGVLTNPALDTMDPALALRFGEAMNRATRHVIQEADPGALPEFMHSLWGRILMQFRSFTTAAYTRHTLHGIAKHDAIAGQTFVAGMGFSALGYIGMVQINYANDPERREKMLQPEQIAKMAFARSTDATIIPMLYDSVADLVGEDKQFAFSRSSGLGSDFVTGNPTINTINRIGEVAKIPTNAVRSDAEVTREQANAAMSLVWANRLPALLNVHRAVSDQFPSAAEAEQNR